MKEILSEPNDAQRKRCVVEDFLTRQKGRISDRRYRTNRSYLEGFKEEFGKQSLHDVHALAPSDWIDRKAWGKRTAMTAWAQSVFYIGIPSNEGLRR